MPAPWIAQLKRPDAYDHPVDDVTLIQTHISYVFIAGDHVYKVKKPVDLGFLDFSTLAKRKHFCEEEVRLNSRTCSTTYHGVVPVTREGRRYRFGGTGDVVDYAVHMRLLPKDRALDSLLGRVEVTETMLGELAAALVQFHAGAETSDRLRALGGYTGMARNWRANLAEIAPLVGKVLPQGRYDRIVSAVESALARERPLFRRREAEGRVRDGHGDLRADAVYFDGSAPGGLCIVDCIEFDERFRVTDTGLDLAFLAMDLEARGHRDFADLLCGLYVAASGDSTLPIVLEFYKAYRAVIRGKVRGILLGQPEVPRRQRATARREAAARFRLAETCLRRKTPRTVVLVMGPSGTGKSRIAGPLAVRIGAAYISTDVTRKQLAGLQPWQSGATAPDTGLYESAASERVYGEIAARTAAWLDEGRSVVIDGTFLTRERRAPIEALARRTRSRLLVVDCQAPEGVVQERQQRRRGQAWTTSDGTWDIYLAQRKSYAPPDELPAHQRLALDSTLPTPEAIATILQKLRIT